MPHTTFHLLTLSPWPVIGSTVGLFLAFGLIILLHMKSYFALMLSMVLTLVVMALWWRDVIRESSFMGAHTSKVRQGLEMGMILFITSEVMFFVAFFWAFFHSSLAPSYDIGCSWPPAGIHYLNPFSIPLLNTSVLLASGATVTWAHHGLLNGYKCELSWGLGVTIVLGAYFSFLQMGEYNAVSFAISDSVYGAAFFVATGFHGLHVLIGSLFLSVCWIRSRMEQFNDSHHFGLEAAAWYWHFVDVVWIFLFLSMYWWASV